MVQQDLRLRHGQIPLQHAVELAFNPTDIPLAQEPSAYRPMYIAKRMVVEELKAVSAWGSTAV